MKVKTLVNDHEHYLYNVLVKKIENDIKMI